MPKFSVIVYFSNQDAKVIEDFEIRRGVSESGFLLKILNQLNDVQARDVTGLSCSLTEGVGMDFMEKKRSL